MAETLILGLDPGLRHTGWGIIASAGNRLRFVAAGALHPSPGLPMASRLAVLADGLTRLIAEHQPDEAAVEETFVNGNARAALKLGQARGIALLVPAQFGLTVGEYAPNAVKKTVVGVGHADKGQVDHMVRVQLPGVKIAGPDAADALAIAICHAHHLQSAGRLAAAIRGAA